ncbi:hypothetical protein [Lactococcus lactis]|uniref:Collagen-like protein n=1 Tax=Lactococcus lactis TaxID=1358 RepID=A0AAP3Z0G7_9LACT|nr:hypothetical protein [Lactococcus lactis]MDG4976101.1 collagen-like protein [Lactococcus lactis]
MNSTNLRQVDGGTFIKQGDFSSEFAFELLDENNQLINLDDEEAIITLSSPYDRETFFEKTVTVKDGKISFQIDEILPIRYYIIEVKCADYVFPSDNRFQIEVTKGSEDYIPKDPLGKVLTETEVIELLNEPEFIAKVTGPKGDTGISTYDLWLSQGNTGTEQDFIDSLRGADGLAGPIGATGPQGATGATGTQGTQGIKGDKGDTGTSGQDGNDGQDGKSTYQIWLDLGNVGSEQDFIDSLAPKIERHAPTGYSLDRTTRPWTIHFDNGCDLLMPDYATTETIYGYGYTAYNAETEIEQFPLSEQVMRTSRGHLTIEKWKTSNAACAYWANSTIVINPINDQKLFDFSHAQLNPNDTDKSYSLVRQKNFIRVMYELGIWSEVDIVSLGAVKL